MRLMLSRTLLPSRRQAATFGLAAALLVAAGWGFRPTAPEAQAGAISSESVLGRLERLEAEAARLSGALGSDGQPRLILAQSGSLPGSYAGQVEVRLSQLEAQLRDLTGRIEQVQYEVRQLSDQMQRNSQDVDFRLSALEGGSGGDGPTGPLGPIGPIAGSSPPASTGGTAPGDIGPTYERLTDLAAPQDTGGTLGQLTLTPGDDVGGATGTDVAALPAGDAQAQYDFAYQLLQRADYPAAETALQQFISANPTHPLASNAQYWLGETYYVRGRFNDAAIAFAQSYQRYPTGAKAVDSLLKLGMSLAALGQRDDACLTFAQLRTEFPSAPALVINRADEESDRLQCQ